MINSTDLSAINANLSSNDINQNEVAVVPSRLTITNLSANAGVGISTNTLNSSVINSSLDVSQEQLRQDQNSSTFGALLSTASNWISSFLRSAPNLSSSEQRSSEATTSSSFADRRQKIQQASEEKAELDDDQDHFGLRRPHQRKEFEEYNKFMRYKRALDTPNDNLGIDISRAYGHGFDEPIKEIMQAIKNPDVLPRNKLTAAAEAINTVRMKSGGNNAFMQDVLTMYATHMLDTNPSMREAYTFYQQKTKESVQGGRFYVDADLERFYSTVSRVEDLTKTVPQDNVPRPQFNDPEFALSLRTDYLLAKLLIANNDNAPLNPQKLGLAWGELSVFRQIFQANADLQYTDELAMIKHSERNNRVGKSIEAQMNANDKRKQHKFQSVESPFSKIMSDGAPISPKGQGACHLIAYSAALEMSGEGANTDALTRILSKIQTMKDDSSLDPSKAHRLLSGLTEINDQLQSKVNAELAPFKVRVHDFDALALKIPKIDQPMVLTFRDGDNNPHVVSVSPIHSPQRSDPGKMNKGFLVVDSSLGVVPCATADAAIRVLKLSAQRYLGNDISNMDLRDLRISSLTMDANVKPILDFKMRPIGNNEFIPVGPKAEITRPNMGITDYFAYKHIFSAEGPSWGNFARPLGTTSSEAWKGLLPKALAKKTVQGDFNLDSGLRNRNTGDGKAYLTSKTEEVVNTMRLLASEPDLACAKGVCSLNLKDYIETKLPSDTEGFKNIKHMEDGKRIETALRLENAKHTSVDDVLEVKVRIGQEGGRRIHIELVEGSDYAELRMNAPKIDELAPPPPPRGRSNGRTPARRLSERQSVKIKSGHPSLKQKISVGEQLTDRLQRLRQEANTDLDTPPRRHAPPTPDNVYRRALDESYQRPAFDPDPGQQAPALPKPRKGGIIDLSQAGTRSSAVNEGLPQGNTKIGTISGGAALEGASVASHLIDDLPPARIRRQGGIKRAPNAQNKPAVLDTPPSVPPRDPADTSGRQQMQKAGKELLQRRKRAPAPPPEGGLERGGKDEAKPRALPPSKEGKSADSIDPVKILADIVEAEDPATTRAMTYLMEDVKVQVHRAQAVMGDIEQEATGFIKGKGLVPEDWVVIPPKAQDIELKILYRGSDESITDRIQKMQMPEGYTQRISAAQDSIARLHAQIEDSPRFKAFNEKIRHMVQSGKSIGISKVMKTFGKVIGFAGKGMSMFSMYTLVNESKELANLETQHKVAFALSATDGIFDALSLLAGGINKAAKTLGYTSDMLQAASRGLGTVSMGIGVGVSVGLTFTHMYAISQAQTPMEYEISVANTAFSTSSVILTGMMIGFPPAMPIIALFQFSLMGIQYAVIQAIIDKHMRENAKNTIHERWKNTEELLKLVSQIGQATVEEVSVTRGPDGETTLHIHPKAANIRIDIKGNNVKIYHISNAYSAAYQVNKFTEEKHMVKSTYTDYQVGAPYIKYGDSNNRRQWVSDWDIRESLTRTASCLSNHMVEDYDNSQMYSASLSHVRILKAETGWGQYTLKSTERTNEIMTCLLLDDPANFKTNLEKYLASETPLTNAPDVIVLNEIAPEIELVSDVTHFLEDEYMTKAWTTHPHVNAITNQCQAKATSRRQEKIQACQSVSEQVEGISSSDICKSTSPSFKWSTKATSYLPPDVTNCNKNPHQLMNGYNFVVSDFTSHDRRANSRGADGLHPVRKTGVSTIPTNVYLKVQESQIKIDIDKKDDDHSIKLIILPEKISTGLMTKTMPYYGFDYGSKEQKGEARILKVHPWSYGVTTLSTYKIDLIANQDVSLILSSGTKTQINEKDNASKERKGEYLITFFSPNSQEKQEQKIESLKKEKIKSEGVITKERLKLPALEKEYTDALAKLQDLRDSGASGFGGSDNHERKVAAQYELDDALKELTTMNREIAGNENRVAELSELIPAEEKIQYVPVRKLKTKIGYNTETKTFTLDVNPDQTEEYNKIHLKIQDIQRKVTLIHNEPVKINDVEINIGCIFDVNFKGTTPKLELTQIASLSAADISKINGNNYIPQLIAQLEQNNPQFDASSIPKDTISTLTLSLDDKKFVGMISASQTTGMAGRKKRSIGTELGNDPNAFTGHVILLDLSGTQKLANRSNAVSVIYPKASSASDIEMYQRLAYVGEEKIVSQNEVPVEYQALYDSTQEKLRTVYYLYDDTSRTIVKQWMNSAIRKEDISICAANESPRKFIGKSGQAPIYKCSANNSLNLLSVVAECKAKESGTCSALFDDIAQKQKDDDLPTVLTIQNPGSFDDENAENTPLWMEYIGGNNPALMLIEEPKNNKKVGVLTRDLELGYALIAEEIETAENNKAKLKRLNDRRKSNGLPPTHEIRISATHLLKDDALTKAGNLLASANITANGIPKNTLQQILQANENLAEDLHLVSVIKNPEGGFILETLDGVAFSLSQDLQEKHLVATGVDYFENNQIDITSTVAIRDAYAELERQYGIPNVPYIKMSEGQLAQSGEISKPIIFMDTVEKSPLFVPRNNQTSSSTYLLSSLESDSRTILLTAVDPESHSIITVIEPMIATNSTLTSTLDYAFLKINQESITLSLRSHTDTAATSGQNNQNNTVPLPYLQTKSLYLLPQIDKTGTEHTKLEIGKLMREQLNMISLVPPADVEDGKQKEGVVQTISLQKDENKEIKAFVEETTYLEKTEDPNGKQETKEIKRLLLALPKIILNKEKQKGIKFAAKNTNDLSEEYTLIHLFDAFDSAGNMTTAFDDRIIINGQPLDHSTLIKLVGDATILSN